MASAVAVLLVAATGAGQLPPEVLADSYLLQVEQAIRDEDHSRAWARIQDIQRLQTDHDLDLPEFDFWYARAAHAMSLPERLRLAGDSTASGGGKPRGQSDVAPAGAW